MQKDFITPLTSVRRANILDALYSLGALELSPDPSLLGAVINLFEHSDADIREQAIAVAAIHWRSRSAYTAIIKQFDSECDQIVLMVMSSALSALVNDEKGDLQTANSLLASLSLNRELDPELRGTAYLSLLRMNKKISIQEYAASPVDIEEMHMQSSWLKSLINCPETE